MIMKYKNILIGSIVAIAVTSCNSLDIPPMNIIQDTDVFQSEAGVTAYIARLYTELPIEDFKFGRDFDQFANYPGLCNATNEALLVTADFVWDNPSGDWFQAWKYGSVRNINYFIEQLSEYQNNFTDELVNDWLGEAYFIRAYTYFAMVKRYGGVPIVKQVQNFPEQSLEDLKVPRSSEQEVYDFIAEDLDLAISLLPEESLAKGRVNKNVAYALKSRVMLYAGSIAQFGKMQLDNLLGIPAADATKYYQAAYDAACMLEGKYSLYNKYTDKYENYWRLFLDADSPENIFCKYFKYPEQTHSFDVLHVPYQMRGAEGYSSRFNPTLDFVQMFDDIDGNSDWLKIGADSDPIRYDHRIDLFSKAEPRLRGTVIFPGDEFKEEEIDIQKGINIVMSALLAPISQIAQNAGYNCEDIVEEQKVADKNIGFDAKDGKWVDMFEAGIIDPTKVTRSALLNAASISALFITTEVGVAEIKSDEPQTPAMPGGMY